MWFLFRAVFWLAVVSVLLPARMDSDEASAAARQITHAAVDYCTQRPGMCLDGARIVSEAASAPVEFLLSVPQPRSASITPQH